MVSSFRAKLFVVDHLPRGSGSKPSHPSWRCQEFVAADLNLDIDVNRSSPGQLIRHTVSRSEVFLFRGIATADRELSRKRNF